MKTAILILTLASSLSGFDIFSSTNAKRIQGKNVGSLSLCADGDALTWVAANNRFECVTGGGGGGVSSVAATGGIQTASGSAITTTGTVRAAFVRNAQTGTTYTVLTGDRGKTVTFSNAASIAVTLPDAGTGFEDGWFFVAKNIGAGTVTINRDTTSTIDGATSITLLTGDFAVITSDGTNYETANNKIISGAGANVVAARTGKQVVIDTAVQPTATMIQNGVPLYCVTSTSTTAYVCALTPSATSDIHTSGAQIRIKMHASNTGSGPTINIDGQGAKPIYKRNGTSVSSAIATGELLINQTYVLTYTSSVASGAWETDIGGGGGGAPAFSAVTAGTNTAALVMGSGGTWRANSADATAPNKSGTSAPGTCTVGDTYLKTDATATQVMYACTATNTWTQQQGTIVDSPWWVWGGMDTNNVIGTNTARQMRFYEFTVLAPGKIVNGASVATGSTGGIFAVGIYNSSCALVAQTETVNISAFDDEQWLALSSAQTLTPGKYYYGIAEQAGTGLMRASLWYYYLNGGRSSSTYGAFTVTGVDATYSAPNLTLPSSCSGTRNNLSSRTPFVVLQ